MRTSRSSVNSSMKRESVSAISCRSQGLRGHSYSPTHRMQRVRGPFTDPLRQRQEHSRCRSLMHESASPSAFRISTPPQWGGSTRCGPTQPFCGIDRAGFPEHATRARSSRYLRAGRSDWPMKLKLYWRPAQMTWQKRSHKNPWRGSAPASSNAAIEAYSSWSMASQLFLCRASQYMCSLQSDPAMYSREPSQQDSRQATPSRRPRSGETPPPRSLWRADPVTYRRTRSSKSSKWLFPSLDPPNARAKQLLPDLSGRVDGFVRAAWVAMQACRESARPTSRASGSVRSRRRCPAPVPSSSPRSPTAPPRTRRIRFHTSPSSCRCSCGCEKRRCRPDRASLESSSPYPPRGGNEAPQE